MRSVPLALVVGLLLCVSHLPPAVMEATPQAGLKTGSKGEQHDMSNMDEWLA
jgi:hypothetical protein